MFKRIVDNQNPRSLATQMRRKRLALFYSLLSSLENPIHILDVGGTEKAWRASVLPDGKMIHITLLNLEQFPTSLPNITSVAGDAKRIEFPDLHFDVVYSNSVIEHVGSLEDQQRVAKEIRRVGKRHFVQTPNRHFPIEPHFVFPLYQFLPSAIQVWLLQNFKLGWIKRTPNKVDAAKIIGSIRLLDKAEIQMLFPGSGILEERVLGLTKSFVAYGGWETTLATS